MMSPLLRDELTKGQPGCKTDEELEARYFPYYDDPQCYWECERKNEDGVCRYCPVGLMFSADLRQCVAAECYEWTPTVPPPSWPDKFAEFCRMPGDRPTNGQPGCKTEEEIQQRYHTNTDDPTWYWECPGLNQLAICRQCPDDNIFKAGQCTKIDNDDLWTNVSEPKSSPDVFVSCY